MNQEELLNEIQTLKKSLYINRIIGVISSVLSLIMIIVLLVGISRMNIFMKEVQVVADRVAEIDMDQVNSAIEKFNATVEKIDFEYLNDSFKEVDMKKIGEIVETINAAELEETLENINTVSEKLKKISDTISGFFSFGR